MLADISCIGLATAKNKVIYLHGIDEKNIGAKEKENRAVLEKLAKATDTIFALPRGNSRCRGSEICWNLQDKTSILDGWVQIKTESQKCFAVDQSVTLLGFSNGGYFASKLLHYCNLDVKQIIAVGSAGDPKDAAKDLSGCRPLTLLIGKSDISLAKVKAYNRKLLERKAPVREVVFDGGHVVPFGPMQSILTKSL